MERKITNQEFGKIGVLMGGTSSERDISLKSGKAVYDTLRSAKLNVVAIDLTTEDKLEVSSLMKKSGISLAFIALHGKFGEDGSIQSILDELNILYTGSGASASRLAMDKVASRKIFKTKNIPVPDCEIFQKSKNSGIDFTKSKFNGSVVVVKPAKHGSSIGISFVEKKADLPNAINEAFRYDEKIIVEEYLSGREITVGILEEKTLPVVEIIPKKRFFDFQAKYEKDMTTYQVPAKISPSIYKKSQEIALKAHKALGCRGFSRVDMILKDNTPYVLEVNSIPGLTSTSLLPKAALAVDIDFTELCLRIIKNAYGKKKK